MTGRAQWPYPMAAVILVAALAVTFWPETEVTPAEPPHRIARGLAARAPDAAALEDIAAWAGRLPLSAQMASIEQAASDQPPAVTGVVRVGGRGFAYIAGGERSGRLSIGQTSGGWTLTGVGANYAQFSRAGETRRVRLFARPAGPAVEAAQPAGPDPAKPQDPAQSAPGA